MDSKRKYQLRADLERTTHRGSVLLIALLVLGAITLSTIYLSLVLLTEIRSTRYADNSIVSHYVAETGSENALWRLKRAKENSTPTLFRDAYPVGKAVCAAESGGSGFPGIMCPNRCSLSDTSCTSNTDCSVGETCVPVSGIDPERTYSYTKEAIAATDFTVYNVPRNSPIFADIYDPFAEGKPGQNTHISELRVTWYVTSLNAGSAKLEVTYTPVDIQTLALGTPTTVIDICGANASSGDPATNPTSLYKCAALWADPYSMSIPGLSQSKFYRISFRSLDTAISKLVMIGGEIVSSSFVPKDIPSQVEVAVTGTYRESQSKVSLRTLWKDTLSGIFNYVIFSEDSLIKDTKGATSSAYDSLCGFYTQTNPNAAALACSVTAGSPPAGYGVCSVANTSGDVVDAAVTANFCYDTTNGETYTDGQPIIQTDAGQCNALCNGYTFCGDGTLQSPNGIGYCNVTGAVCRNNGECSGGETCVKTEACDEGPGNSDTVALHCRTDCRIPYCGDGVPDNGTYIDPALTPPNNSISYTETCDEGATNSDSAPLHCRTNCRIPYCGDGVIDNGNYSNPLTGATIHYVEACDEGPDNGQLNSCNSSCTGIQSGLL